MHRPFKKIEPSNKKKEKERKEKSASSEHLETDGPSVFISTAFGEIISTLEFIFKKQIFSS